MVVTVLFKGVKQTTFKTMVLFSVEKKILQVWTKSLHLSFKRFFRVAKEHESLKSIPLPYS